MENPMKDSEEDYGTDEIELQLGDCLNSLGIESHDTKGALESSDVLQAIHDLLSNRPQGYRNKLKELESRIDKQESDYFKALIFLLYLRNKSRIEEQNLPSKVAWYLEQDFSRIMKIAMKDDKKFLTFSKYHFLSYLEKLSLCRYPVGCQDVVIHGFSRQLIIRQSFADTMKLLALMIRIGGNRPLFELHYNPHRFRLFNAKGWQEVFHQAAQMMVRFPEVKGLFGAAWFYDPVIKEISPELYYIRELIEGIGGHFFFEGESEDTNQDAFAFSKARRMAYEEGRYSPKRYTAIIPRSALLDYSGM
jgi:hypothetical protein